MILRLVSCFSIALSAKLGRGIDGWLTSWIAPSWREPNTAMFGWWWWWGLIRIR